ncbi:conserved hypothetical protein [Streptomyces himastatinicus ATCC 53653]|uniref:DUF1795 domain-containing protein n=1 Tax=Streptomyces himastatinicus ATCC 53653 TaxID=457427 RepID=D9WCX8_9ACTN|nr:hypothetical protein [Streptomyces himastatinicus]EFL23057.1 conserved hypothetical protein [Streptomyces himastatinicus ATCC 53653]
MPMVLPVSIEFRLPEGWYAVPPDQVGAPDVAFVARHPQPDAGFTANITVDGDFRPDASALAEIADESVQRMREIAESLWVTGRDEIGSVDAPGLTQELALSAVAGGVRRDLVQSQVYLSMLDIDDPSKRSVIRLALTATADQFDSVLEDFREFVRTVRPETRTSA